MEGRWQITSNDIYLGVSGAWNVFYEEESGTFENDNRTTTGTAYNYINAYPLLVSAYKYFNLSESGLAFYGGVGLGTYYVEQKQDYGLYSDTNSDWKFGFAPEIGLAMPGGGDVDFLVSVEYNYALKTSSLPAFSSLGINIGIIF